MFGLSFLEISSFLGLSATVVLTFNFLLGMMLGTAYKRSGSWQKLPVAIKKINVDDLHNQTAYVALLLVVLHPLFLVFDKNAGFTLSDILFPLKAPKQNMIVLLGCLSLYGLMVVIITTQKLVKKKLRFRTWKNIHLISYATALLFIFHGLLMDPKLKDRPTDWLDTEKLLSEFCLLILVTASVVRYRYHVKNKSVL